MIIRDLNVGDAKIVARLHKRAFNNFFLTKLGHRFLVAFYIAIFQSKDSINLGLFLDDELVGFAVGAKKSKSFYSNLLNRNFLKLGLSAFIPLLLNPSNIYRLFISLTSSNGADINIKEGAILLSICVDPINVAKGNGRLLLCRFEGIAFDFSDIISLTTDAVGNDSVNSFYISNGYKLHTSFYQGERKMNYYIKTKN
jgi:hypothetical protein